MYAKTTDNLEAWSYGVKANYLLDTFNQLIDRGRKGECPADWGLMHLAEVYMELGHEDEARGLMAQALDIRPGLSLASFRQGEKLN